MQIMIQTKLSVVTGYILSFFLLNYCYLLYMTCKESNQVVYFAK